MEYRSAKDIPLAYRHRIQAIMPDLVITSMHFNQDGMVNDVVGEAMGIVVKPGLFVGCL